MGLTEEQAQQDITRKPQHQIPHESKKASEVAELVEEELQKDG